MKYFLKLTALTHILHLMTVKALGKNSAILLPAEEITDPEEPSKWIPEIDDSDDDFYVMEEPTPGPAPKPEKIKKEKKKNKSKLLEGMFLCEPT